MATRMKFSDARWFADYRPVCAVENQMKNELGAKNEFEYAELLQKNAEKVFAKQVRKVPDVKVNATVVIPDEQTGYLPGYDLR